METFLIDVPMPSMGATVSELTVIDIKVAPGATIAKGEKIAELESDKSVFEYEAPCDGQIVAVRCRAGDIVPSNGPFLRIATADIALKHLEVSPAQEVLESAAASKATSSPQARAAISPPAVRATPVAAPSAPQRQVRAVSPVPPSGGLLWTPRALKLVQEAGLTPETLTGVSATGPGGRVSGDDVARYLEQHADSRVASPAVMAESTSSCSTETVRIAGVGYAVPQNIRPTSEILRAFPDRTEEEMLKLTGIKERRYASGDETATSLAATAVRRALAQAGMSVDQIDGIILATIIPDQPVPAMASALALHLGIPKALAFDLNAACSGWLYALEVGRSFIRGGTARNLVVVTAELLSRITNPKDHETAFLFGDGAGAAILTDSPGGHRLHRMALSGDATQFAAIQRRGGGATRPFLAPGGADQADFYLQMNGALVFKSAVVGFADQIEATLKRHNLAPEDIAWVVPHQANERILRAVSKRIGIPFEKVVMTISRYGNTSGASVSMALGWAAQEGIFQPGDRIIFCSVGAGLTFAGGLLVW
ncbi:MAG: beta-ketoacyl-ACP synthase 3 [Opitutaceae bacterium]|nr:beta-ketoacyl-ACP synthase 3 [Opitutaceae bacterium]